MRRSKRGERLSKFDEYKLILDFLRYAVTHRIHPIRVGTLEPASVPPVPDKQSATQLLLEMAEFPIWHHGNMKLPISVKALRKFLQSWYMQEQFLQWYGIWVARSIPKKSPAMMLKKSFENLRVGRAGKVPPQIFLRVEYNNLVADMRDLQSKFPGRSLPLSRKDREAMMEFGRKQSGRWVEILENGEIDLDQIVTATPKSGAKLILANRYGCEEDSISSLLSRGR